MAASFTRASAVLPYQASISSAALYIVAEGSRNSPAAYLWKLNTKLRDEPLNSAGETPRSVISTMALSASAFIRFLHLSERPTRRFTISESSSLECFISIRSRVFSLKSSRPKALKSPRISQRSPSAIRSSANSKSQRRRSWFSAMLSTKPSALRLSRVLGSSSML